MSQLTDFTKPLSAFPKIKGVTLESDPLDGADVEQPAPIDQPTETQHKLDSYIAANRESTPPTAVANRRVPRASIAELNQTDMDEIRRRLLTVNRDNRSPAMKVLDLIDAPRNVIMGLVAPSLRSKAEQSGDTGAFGLGRVQFSDVLRDLGLNNRVANGLLGFVGDVAFDPLTYVGPAGWGAELAAKTGASLARVGLRQAGTKVLRKEIANVAAGGMKHVADETAHAYLLAKGFTPDRVAELVSANGRAGAQSAIAKEVFGDPSKSILEKVFRPLGGEKTFESASGNLASDLFSSSGPAKEAAASFVAKYGKGTGRALRIGTGGKAGSEVLHVPFMSDLTVQVPAFTAKARANARNLALAKSATLGVSENIGALSDPILQASESIIDSERQIRDHFDTLASERAMHEELLKSLPNEEPPPAPVVPGTEPVSTPGGEAGALPMEPVHGQETQGREGLLSPEPTTPEAGTPGADKPPAPAEPVPVAPTVSERTIESERWSAREQELRESIGKHIENIADTRDKAAEALAAFDPNAAAAGVQNPNDVLRLGEMLSEADAALQSAITRSHWLNMAKAAVQKDELGVRAIDVEDAADLAQQLGDDLYHLVASDPDAADKLSDAVQARMQALGDYRESLRSTLQAVSSSDDDQIVDAAKMVLGTDDEQIVLSAFAPMGHFLRDKFGEGNKAAEIADKMDRFWRRTFGVRRGFLNQTLAEIKANYTKTSASTKMHAQAELLQTVKDLGLNLPPEEAVPFFHAWVWQRMDPERNRFFWWKMGPDGENLGPSELATLLQRATDNGVFANPATAQKLDEAADRFIEKLRVLGESEQDQGILGLLRQDYIPSGLTREAEQAAREHRAAGSVSQGGSKGGFPTQAFQKAKTTDQVRFPVEPSNPDGPWRRFFVGEMYLADVPDEALTPERLASKQSILDYLARAEADPQFAATYTPRPTDPWELNDLAASGDRFQHLTGGMPLESLFDTDLATLYGKRMGSHVRAEAVQDLGRLFLTNGVRIDPALLDKFGQFKGVSKRLEGGTMAKIIGTVDTTLEGGSGMAHAVQIGDTMYRRLDPRVWTTQDNVFSQMLGRLPVKAEEMLLHHAVADHIEAVYKFGQPETLEKFLRATDTMIGMWKQLTLFHPSWVVGNMVGDAMLAISGGADPTHFFDPRNVRDMIRIRTMMHQPEKLKDMVLTLRTGQEIPARDFLQMAVDNRIIDNALTAEAMAEIAQKTPGILSIPDRVLRKHLGFWFRGNQITQDAMRMNAFLSYLNQGYDAVSAQRRVLASMFDYGDFTRIEERLFRRLFPFYSWIRNNLGYQIMLLGERPMWAGMAPKLQTALQEMAAGEATVPDNQRPTWMRNALATQIGTDPNKRFALMLGNLLPTGDLLTALQPIMGVEGAMQFLHYFAGNLTPAISTPLQAGTGTEFFSGRTIGSDSLGGDVSIGENLLGLVRPVSEAKAIGRAYEQGGIGQAASRLVLAGRVQAFDQQRLDTTMRRDFRDEEQRLRASIYKAERRGNTEVSQRARAALLALYRDALKRGMDDMVPKWAEDQLQTLVQTQPAA